MTASTLLAKPATVCRGRPYTRSTFTDAKPSLRASATRASVCSTDCTRWMASWTAGVKSCTPIETRLNPLSRNASR
jgi:hypothetical protein